MLFGGRLCSGIEGSFNMDLDRFALGALRQGDFRGGGFVRCLIHGAMTYQSLGGRTTTYTKKSAGIADDIT